MSPRGAGRGTAPWCRGARELGALGAADRHRPAGRCEPSPAPPPTPGAAVILSKSRPRPPPPPLPFSALLPDEGKSPSAARRALTALLPARLPRRGDAGLGPRPGQRGKAEHMEVPDRCRLASLLLLLASCIGCTAAPRRNIPRRQGRDPRRGCGGCSLRETSCSESSESSALSAPRSFGSLYNWRSVEHPSIGPGRSLHSGYSEHWEKPECCPEPRPAPRPALPIGEAAGSA